MELEHSGFFVLRTPASPVSDWLDFGAGLTAAASRDRECWRAERDLLRQRLRRIVTRADVAEAIFVASPSLSASIAEWLRDADGERGQKVERALVRYVARMTGRATPFGLFAGWSLGALEAPSTELRLLERARDRRHCRVDNDLLASLTATLADDVAIRRQLRVAANDTIYRIDTQLRYVTRRFAGGARVLELAAVDADEHVLAALARAADEPTAGELARALATDADVELDEAQEFVDELLTEQLLLSQLELPVTGGSPLAAVIAALPPAAERVRDVLVAVQAELRALDEEPIGAPVERYHSLTHRLAQLAEPSSRTLQIDLQRPTDRLGLGAAPLAELMRAVELLHRIARRPPDPLAEFRTAFHERYGTREVALVEALDEESGVGFDRSNESAIDPSPLLAGLRFGSSAADETRFTARDSHLLRRLDVRGGGELHLDDEDLAALADPDPLPLPDAFTVRATISAASSAAVAAGDYLIHLQGVNGPSGANLLGRFCGADEALRAAVARHLRAEEAHRPDAIFAEILHLPEGRLGNVVLRPTLRGHEICVLGRSGLPRAQQLTLDDLRVSVRGDRVILRSARLDREILPRLTTAHNFATRRSLGVYRFLCALQHQGTAGASFHWGPLANAPVLPRVRHGRVVLSLARWSLDARSLAPLGEGDAAARFFAVQRLRAALGLPRRVALVESDHVLPIDLDHALSVESFVQLVHRRQLAVLTESFPDPDRLCVESPAGRFTHELLIPLHRRTPPAPAASATRSSRTPSTLQRRFIPGSEWLSFKIYPAIDLEQLLVRVLAPIIDEVVARGAADRWFFLRYRDPAGHLRLRFGGARQRLTTEVLPAVSAALEPLVADGRVWRVQLGTYDREIERYGGDAAMPFCEEIFCADSEAVLALLRAPHAPDQRWQWALRGMDLLLDDLGLDLPAKASISERARELFFADSGGDPTLARSIGARHRALRDQLATVFADDDRLDPRARPAWRRRTERIAKLRARPDWPAAPLRAEVAGSLLHMHANRMLRGASRAQELVLYDFLFRHYLSLGKRR